MLVIDTNRTVKWPVTIKVPMDGGQVKEHPITATFKLLNADSIEQAGDQNVLLEHWKGWEDGDFVDTDEQPIPYTEENKRALVKIHYIEKAVTMALVQASNGAPVKN